MSPNDKNGGSKTASQNFNTSKSGLKLSYQRVQFSCHEECLQFLHALLTLIPSLLSSDIVKYIQDNGINVDAISSFYKSGRGLDEVGKEEELNGGRFTPSRFKGSSSSMLQSLSGSPINLVHLKDKRPVVVEEGKKTKPQSLFLFDDAISYVSEDKEVFSPNSSTNKRGAVNRDPFDSFFQPSLSGRHINQQQGGSLRDNHESFPSIPSSTDVSFDPSEKTSKSTTTLPKPSFVRGVTEDSLNVSDDSILLMEDLQEEPIDATTTISSTAPTTADSRR